MPRIPIAYFIFLLVAASAARAQWQPFTMFNSPLPTDALISLSIDPENKVMVGTQGRGLVVKSGDQWRIYNQNNAAVPINYPFQTIPKGDTLFIGSASGNLDQFAFGEGVSILRLSDSTWHQLNSGIEINQIVTGIINTDSYRAVSTYGGGITLYNSLGWVRYQTEFRTEYSYADSQMQTFKVPFGTYLPSDYVKGIDYDRASNTLWIATLYGGAVSFDGSVWQTYNMSNSGLPSNRVQVVKANRFDNKVYFGSFGFGLTAKSGDSWIRYTSSNSPLIADFIYSLEVRPDNGDLWIGTNYGISVLSTDGSWHSYIPGDSNLVWGSFYSDIAFDSIGNVWVATYGGGMACKQIIPQEEPADTLAVTVNKLKFFIRQPRRDDITWLNASIEPAPQLTDSDSVSVVVSSHLGRIYGWEKTFDPFRRILHWNGTDIYLASADGSIVLMRYRTNLGRINFYLLDWRGQVNNGNMQSWVDVRLKLGNYIGHALVAIGPADPTTDSDADTVEYRQGDSFWSSEYGPVITEVDDDDLSQVPFNLSIPQAYPNPFNSQVKLSFSLTRPSDIEFEIYDILGRKIHSDRFSFDAGEQVLGWNGDGLPTGVYYYRLGDGLSVRSGKITLLK